MDTDGNYDICPICIREDDPFQKENKYDSGSNQIPLIKAQQNYITYGAREKRFIKNFRKANSHDKRDPDWKAMKDEFYELKLTCRKFKEGTYNIADLEHNLSWIGVPNEITEFVKKAEQGLEIIRICTSDYKQREEALDVVDNLLRQLIYRWLLTILYTPDLSSVNNNLSKEVVFGGKTSIIPLLEILLIATLSYFLSQKLFAPTKK